jgi:DNA-binding MarR family transcriptional regulator
MYHIRSNVLHNGETVTSLPQTRVLAFIHNCPGSSLSRLADSLAVTRATASTMVDKLVRSDMVVRTTDPTDRRNVILSLTRSGESQLLATRRIAIAELAEVVKALPPEKLATMEESLGLLKDLFSQANARLK